MTSNRWSYESSAADVASPYWRLGIFGQGRLASAILEASPEEIELAWTAGRGDQPTAVDVAIDASIAEAVPAHLDWATASGTPLVIAATGWQLDDLEARIDDRTAVLIAPNGSLTVALMTRLARILGAYTRTLESADGWLLDHHHGGKRDAPSGTALRLAEAFRLGSGMEPSVASMRAGHEVGRHILGLDSPGEVLEIHHQARSRATFAAGLLAAARWLRGRRGVFTMDDFANHVFEPLFATLCSTHPIDNDRTQEINP